ncbi:hypothetical protein P0082_03815 [Candidatus Haliotispira prima]|uniref:Uncharacterized protein n=1 Tax=Candidatus Haliotispira prima TaxID=3034016 RepID=A0ABY8MJ01_9SPIO|nr:hypothetical protein P0082_03815 [Candidatus Haliotispira prima]
MASSVQLEMSSSLALTDVGAIIRLATEAAPAKVQAEANAGYVSLDIPANSPRKFSISQHYASDFTDGLTLADVLNPNTAYKLYLYFPATTEIKGVSLTGDVGVISITTENLPVATDTVWSTSFAEKQYVASLSEWYFGTEQKGVFIAYSKMTQNFNTIGLSTRKKDKTLEFSIGNFTLGRVHPNSGYLFNIGELGSAYPSADNFYYILGVGHREKIVGQYFRLEEVSFSGIRLFFSPLTRY